MPSLNSFAAASELRTGARAYKIFRLAALEKSGFNLARIPYSIKILLENLLRFEDNVTSRRADIEYVETWDTACEPLRELAGDKRRSLSPELPRQRRAAFVGFKDVFYFSVHHHFAMIEP